MGQGQNLYVSKEKYHTPRSKHTPGQYPLETPAMKGIPENSLLVKVARGVFQFGVLKQP